MANLEIKDYATKTKGKLWYYRIRIHDKTLLSKSGFKTKKEANEDALQHLPKFNQSQTFYKEMSLAELVHLYLENKVYGKHSKSTDNKYKTLEKKISKEFGRKNINKYLQSDYQREMDKIGQSIGYDYLSRINSMIRKTIKWAIADKIYLDDFTQNVILSSKVSKQEEEDKFIHSLEDYDRIIDYLKKKMDYKLSVTPYIIYFLFKTGFRFGELIATKWSDIDFNKGYIRTTQRFNRTICQFVPAKNKTSIRQVPVSANDLKIFLQLKHEQSENNKNLHLENEKNFIFYHYGAENGVPNLATVNKGIRSMLKKLEIEPIISSKGARHTFGSVLLTKGVDIQVVAKLMGHKDTSMLIKVYAHLLDELRVQEFDKVKGLLE
jgi:integrase